MRHFHLNETAAAKRLVMEHHYSGRWPSGAQLVGTFHEDGGLFGDSGDAVAACVFAQPATAGWQEPVLELARLVRRPDCTAPLSGLVSQTVRWVRRKRLADVLVSYADPGAGHHGGIYQACSWHYNGQRPTDMDGAFDTNGVFIPARTLNSRYGTSAVAKLIDLGLEPHHAEGKHLYWLALNRAGRRRATRLGLVSAPYPKPGEAAA